MLELLLSKKKENSIKLRRDILIYSSCKDMKIAMMGISVSYLDCNSNFKKDIKDLIEQIEEKEKTQKVLLIVYSMHNYKYRIRGRI